MYCCKMLPVIKTVDDVSLMIAEKDNLPFEVKRFFVIYGFNNDSIVRGFHAHKKCEQLIFCLQGSVTVHVIGRGLATSREYFQRLTSKNQGLHIPPMNWNELLNISKDSIILVLASHEYDESDYIRDYDEFMRRLYE